MTNRIREDLALIKTAVAIADGMVDSIAYTAAHERLFKPRSLRELVAEGYKRFQIKHHDSDQSELAELDDEGLWVLGHDNNGPLPIDVCGDAQAIPIPHPDDMPQEVG